MCQHATCCIMTEAKARPACSVYCEVTLLLAQLDRNKGGKSRSQHLQRWKKRGELEVKGQRSSRRNGNCWMCTNKGRHKRQKLAAIMLCKYWVCTKSQSLSKWLKSNGTEYFLHVHSRFLVFIVKLKHFCITPTVWKVYDEQDVIQTLSTVLILRVVYSVCPKLKEQKHDLTLMV